MTLQLRPEGHGINRKRVPRLRKRWRTYGKPEIFNTDLGSQ
ncbi:MAG: hypothetical protein DLM68_12445 [Hyphomicrobiales bacterium]|nr:MAG: hypothetical protein DLM68_12445 [Hyphomicrobiales bacterium]